MYLGLKEFSARRAAANFTPEQLRRLLGVARERGGRVYLALNTVVREQELERAADSLFWAEALGLDGVIVQDLGIAELARRHFPALPLHASTQMAVHDSAGLRAARALGFRRVILARELDLAAIRRLRAENPDIELEVFIHGALCYSFSGLCLASWALTGRSGNRGDCAQICRSLFRCEAGEGFFFSCRDLDLGREVLRLREAGVDALKIEGRMKSPEYVFHTVKLYRAILDRGEELPERELEELERRSALGFARERTRGYLRSPKGERLLDPVFPGHRGAPLGTVETVREGRLSLRLEADLGLRDGVQYFPAEGEPVQFAVRGLTRNGRETPVVRRGQTAEIELPPEARGRPPAAGQRLHQLSSRALDLPQPKEGGFRPYRVPCPGTLELSGGKLEVTIHSPLFAGPFHWETPLALERATARKAFAPIAAEVFREAGDSLLQLDPADLRNRTGLPEDEIFVPPSALKKARTAFYAALGRALEERRRERLRQAAGDLRGGRAAAPGPELAGLLAAAARREQLVPRAEAVAGVPHPFVDLGLPPEPSELAEAGGRRVAPLPPVTRSGQWGNLRELADRHSGIRFLFGLSNLAHLELARELAACGNVEFFADFPLYAANRYAVSLLSRQVPKLRFAYHWLEGSEEDFRSLAAEVDLPLVRAGPGFRPPLFYGMSCPRGQQALAVEGQTGCRGCPGGFELPLAQGRGRFLLRVRDCTAYLYELTPSAAGAARGT